MKTNHTPGPWNFGTRNIGDPTWLSPYDKVIHDGAGYAIAVALTDEEQEGNTRLIAAAPELLKSLKQLVDRCSGLKEMHPEDNGLWDAMVKEANNAIAKAEGR